MAIDKDKQIFDLTLYTSHSRQPCNDEKDSSEIISSPPMRVVDSRDLPTCHTDEATVTQSAFNLYFSRPPAFFNVEATRRACYCHAN